jgi:hypothetical protein
MEVTDRGGELRFGVSVVPFAEPPEFALGVTRAAEEAGLDLVGIQDHPYQNRFLDAWTLISTLVSATERVRFFLSVANPSSSGPAKTPKDRRGASVRRSRLRSRKPLDKAALVVWIWREGRGTRIKIHHER